MVRKARSKKNSSTLLPRHRSDDDETLHQEVRQVKVQLLHLALGCCPFTSTTRVEGGIDHMRAGLALDTLQVVLVYSVLAQAFLV